MACEKNHEVPNSCIGWVYPNIYILNGDIFFKSFVSKVIKQLIHTYECL